MATIVNFTPTEDASASELVTLSELKDYLQIAETSYYDDELTAMIRSARMLIEKKAGVSLINRTAVAIMQTTSAFPFKLPSGPVDAVSLVEYWTGTDWDTCTENTDYFVLEGTPCLLDTQGVKGRWRITYALNQDSNTIWATAIKLQCAWWFANRDEQQGGKLAPEAMTIIKSYMPFF